MQEECLRWEGLVKKREWKSGGVMDDESGESIEEGDVRL